MKFNENELNAFYFKKDTKKWGWSVETKSLNLLFRKPRAFPLSYEAWAKIHWTATAKTNVIVRMAPDRLRCGVAKFMQKVPVAALLFVSGHGYPTLLCSRHPARPAEIFWCKTCRPPCMDFRHIWATHVWGGFVRHHIWGCIFFFK